MRRNSCLSFLIATKLLTSYRFHFHHHAFLNEEKRYAMPRILMYGRMFRLETAHVARQIKRLYQGGGGARARVHVRK